MNRQLIFSKNGRLYLDTSMTQDAFSKSRAAEHLYECGYMATMLDTVWAFTPWTFTETSVNECSDESLTALARKASETVLLSGPAFQGQSLKNYFDQAFSRTLTEKEQTRVSYAATLAVRAIQAAVDQKIPLECVGAGGIFIEESSLEGKKPRLIFLPPEIFRNSVSCCGDEIYSEYMGQFINPTLSGTAALHFTQSVIAYRALTGSFPYSSVKTEQRLEDYIDHNFPHLAHTVYALDQELSFFVDSALSRSAKIKPHGKKHHASSAGESMSSSIREDYEPDVSQAANLTLQFPLNTLSRELGLPQEGFFPPTGKLSPVIRKASKSREQFESDAKKYAARFAKKISRTRFFRRHRTGLAVTGAALAAGLIVILSFVHSSGNGSTTRGLTSTQTIEMFYSAYNTLDVVDAGACLAHRNVTGITDTISQIYVTSKSRAMYEVKEKTVSPAEWMNFNYDGNYNIFGLTQLNINSEKASLYLEGPRKKAKPKTLDTENGRPIAKGSTRTATVTYYLVYNQGEETLTVSPCQDTVTLIYSNGRWTINRLVSEQLGSMQIDFKKFTTEYQTVFQSHDNNAVESANLIRENYPWIPSNSEILEGYKLVKKTFEQFGFASPIN